MPAGGSSGEKLLVAVLADQAAEDPDAAGMVAVVQVRRLDPLAGQDMMHFESEVASAMRWSRRVLAEAGQPASSGSGEPATIAVEFPPLVVYTAGWELAESMPDLGRADGWLRQA